MQTLYLIVLSAIGGLLTLFIVAGWSSYKEKKLPDTSVLFRWFVTGLLGVGLATYAWLFGAGGDPTKILESMSEALEVKEVVTTLSSAVGGVRTAVASEAEDIKVGMPTF